MVDVLTQEEMDELLEPMFEDLPDEELTDDIYEMLDELEDSMATSRKIRVNLKISDLTTTEFNEVVKLVLSFNDDEVSLELS